MGTIGKPQSNIIPANQRCRIGCTGLREKSWHLLCPQCWGKLPLSLRNEVYAAYKQCPGSSRHTIAIRVCLDHLRQLDAEKEGGMSKDTYRVGKRVGQDRWQVKQAPGWRVVHQCDTLSEAATWLIGLGVDIRLVPVLEGWPRKMLGEYIAELPLHSSTPQPSQP